jgi:outer membrane receptor protein involved in Fe transport
MISVDFGSTTVLGGVRVEYTDAIYNATLIDFDAGDPFLSEQVQDRTNYIDYLPSLHVTFRPRDNVIVRAAWTNTIGRPDFEDVVPVFEIDGIRFFV